MVLGDISRGFQIKISKNAIFNLATFAIWLIFTRSNTPVEICKWLPKFMFTQHALENQQAKLRLCKLGPGTVWILNSECGTAQPGFSGGWDVCYLVHSISRKNFSSLHDLEVAYYEFWKTETHGRTDGLTKWDIERGIFGSPR